MYHSAVTETIIMAVSVTTAVRANGDFWDELW